MTIGGFTEWAHLRLRDHRPGPMSYTLPASSGPKRSILMRYSSRLPEATVGPGEYQIPTTINQCRSTVFGRSFCADSGSRDAGNVVKLKAASRKSRVQPPPLPKQYSLALTPDTPAFTMYGKSKENRVECSVGPGEYVIPSSFDKLGKGPSIGQRTKLLSSRDVVPGPATYNIPRFGDEKPKKNDYIASIRKVHKEDVGPGPGAYDDPTTIAARFTLPEHRLFDGPLFGGRNSTFNGGMSVGPGPAAYGDVSRIMIPKPTHTPVLRPPMHTLGSSTNFLDSVNYGPSPGSYVLPSDFDCDYNKGPTFGARFTPENKPRVSNEIGPGTYDLVKPPMTSNGFRFAARPYDPFAISLKASSSNAEQNVDSTPGPGAYSVDCAAVRPSRYKAVAGFGTGKRFAEQTDGGPLCYDVKPPEATRGTVFYRGDYSRSKRIEKSKTGGPSYNVENDTIADSVRQKKGFTFGIRYPARATHQVSKPYDETTNINCQYDDETTWMVKIN